MDFWVLSSLHHDAAAAGSQAAAFGVEAVGLTSGGPQSHGQLQVVLSSTFLSAVYAKAQNPKPSDLVA